MSIYTCHLFMSRVNKTEYEIANKVKNSLGYMLPVNKMWDILILSPYRMDSNEIESVIAEHSSAILIIREDVSRLNVQLFTKGQSYLEIDLEEQEANTPQAMNEFLSKWHLAITQLCTEHQHLPNQKLIEGNEEKPIFLHLEDLTDYLYKTLEAESFIDIDFMQLHKLKKDELSTIQATKVGQKESSYFKRAVLEQYKKRMAKLKYKYDKSASLSDEIIFVNNDLDYPRSISFAYLGYESRNLYVYAEVASSYDCATESTVLNTYDLTFSNEEDLTTLLKSIEYHIFDEVIPKFDMRMPKPFNLQSLYLNQIDPIFEPYGYKRLEQIPDKISGTQIVYANPGIGVNFRFNHSKLDYRMSFVVEDGVNTIYLSEWLKKMGIEDNTSNYAIFEGLDTYTEQVMLRVRVIESKVLNNYK